MSQCVAISSLVVVRSAKLEMFVSVSAMDSGTSVVNEITEKMKRSCDLRI